MRFCGMSIILLRLICEIGCAAWVGGARVLVRGKTDVYNVLCYALLWDFCWVRMRYGELGVFCFLALRILMVVRCTFLSILHTQ